MNIAIPCLNKCALFCVRVCSVNHFIVCTKIDLTIQIETWLPVASMQGMFIIQHKTRYCYYFLMWIVLNTCTFPELYIYIFYEIYINVFCTNVKIVNFRFRSVKNPGMYWFLWNACFCLLFVNSCNSK